MRFPVIYPVRFVSVTGRHDRFERIASMDDENRPQDAGDIHSLLHHMPKEAITRTRELLLLITKRGYHRGKKLGDELDQILSAHRRQLNQPD